MIIERVNTYRPGPISHRALVRQFWLRGWAYWIRFVDLFLILSTQGKPRSLARAVDIPRAVHNFRFFATAILHQTDESTHQPEFNALNYVVRKPAGIAGIITPWNLPLYLLTFKLAPAIAAGL